MPCEVRDTQKADGPVMMQGDEVMVLQVKENLGLPEVRKIKEKFSSRSFSSSLDLTVAGV